MPRSFLAYFGHVNIDVLIRIPSFPRVGSVNVTAVSENFGGTAGNFAIVAKKLGYDFDLYASVSGKTHGEYLTYLDSLGINTGHVDIAEDGYGPICYITSDGNDQVAYMYQGPMDTWDPIRKFPKGEEYQWIHFSTGPPETYLKLFPMIGGARVTFDPGQEIHYRYNRTSVEKFIERADMVICNEAELQKMKEITGKGKEWIEASVGTVIITQGSDGVTIMQEGEKEHLSVLPANGVYDTIGAGDSFRAGLYYALSRGMRVRDAVSMGIVVSSKAIEHSIVEFAMTGSEAEKILQENRGQIQSH